MESVSVLRLPVAAFMRVYHLLDDRFDALWPTYVQPDGSLLGLEDQGKGEKGAAFSLLLTFQNSDSRKDSYQAKHM